MFIIKITLNKLKINSLELQNPTNVFTPEKDDISNWGMCVNCQRKEAIISLNLFKNAHYNILISYQKKILELIPFGSESLKYKKGIALKSIRNNSQFMTVA